MIEEHLKLYRFLKKEAVRYIVIGGAAAIAYGVPRTTNDLDIFIDPAMENCKKFLKALKETGLGTAFLTSAEKISRTELTIIEDVIRIDVMTRVKGLDFEKSWNSKIVKEISGVPINFISLSSLIKSKKAAARRIDKDDIKILTKIKKLGR